MDKSYFFNTPEGTYRMKKDYRFPLGRHKGKSIEEVMEWGIVGKSYVAYIYYNVDWIDYAEDIIEAAGLIKIAKPRKDAEKFEAWIAALPEEERVKLEALRMAGASHGRRVRRKEMSCGYAQSNQKAAIVGGKGKLAWKNQGH